MPTTVNFSYTGAEQTVLVPAGVSTATLSVSGASGADNSAFPGTRPQGAAMTVDIVGLVPGETLYVYVGGAPGTGTVPGGWNGGGNGVVETVPGYGAGGGTDIRRGGNTLSDRIVVGGGGGGTGRLTGGATGARGGYPTGEKGYLAFGGTQSGPGPSYTDPPSTTYYDRYGTFGQGATADDWTINTRACGGGGGGWWGGNTIVGRSNFSCSGSGGSSYYDTTDSNVTLVAAEAVGTIVTPGATIIWSDPQPTSNITLGALGATASGVINVAIAQRSARRQHIYISDIQGAQKGVIL